jgi:phenylacetate-CoA ligase
MVSHAYRTVPYYRETMDRLGLDPSSFQSADDLSRLPLLEKEHLRSDPEFFVSTAYPPDRCLKLRTGGSTGVACTVYHNTGALFQNAAHGERERSIITPLLQRSFGYRETVIGSPTVTDRVVQEYCRTRGFFPPGLQIKRQYLSLLDPPETNLRLINEFGPDVIRSYGSYLESLFPHIHAAGAPFRKPGCVTYSSDGLSPSVRGLITEHFDVPVISTYEAVESFKIGFECDQGKGVHQNVDLYPVRIVNDQGMPVPDGRSGEVVVSNLVNRATVLLNYRIGDLATRLPESCPCGRNLPLLSLPEGRNDEYLHLPDGRVVHPQSVRTIVLEEEAVWQFRVIQKAADYLHVALVADPSSDRGQMRKRLVDKFAGLFGSGVAVEIAFVGTIDRGASGDKFRVVISRCRPPGADAPPGHRADIVKGRQR